MDIYNEPRERLLSIDFLEALAVRITELNLSRGRSTDWLATKLFFFDGTIYDWTGKPLYLGIDIVDRAYGEDLAFTWNSDVKAFSRRRPQRRPAHRMLLRLALWDAAFKINGTPVLV